MKILDIIEPKIKEAIKDYSLDPNMTKEEFIKSFELDGKVLIAKAENWGDEFVFDCGPGIGYGGLSDSLMIYEYLETIIKKLNINCDIGASTNTHELEVSDQETANKMFESIKEEIIKDGYVLDLDDL